MPAMAETETVKIGVIALSHSVILSDREKSLL
jgi:hypothetical protein